MNPSDDWPPEEFPESMSDEEMNDALDEIIAQLDLHGGFHTKEINTKHKSLLVDLSDRYPSDEDVLRVELRRTKRAGTDEIEDRFLIGYMARNNFPEENKPLQLYYHNYDGLLNFGYVHTKNPLENVSRKGDYFYFTSNKENWRLAIINDTN